MSGKHHKIYLIKNIMVSFSDKIYITNNALLKYNGNIYTLLWRLGVVVDGGDNSTAPVGPSNRDHLLFFS